MSVDICEECSKESGLYNFTLKKRKTTYKIKLCHNCLLDYNYKYTSSEVIKKMEEKGLVKNNE